MAPNAVTIAQPWREVELTLHAAQTYANGYTALEMWADFAHDSGPVLRRPAFWDGASTWKVRTDVEEGPRVYRYLAS